MERLFNIGLELSMERLASLAKYVFGMGTLQVWGKDADEPDEAWEIVSLARKKAPL